VRRRRDLSREANSTLRENSGIRSTDGDSVLCKEVLLTLLLIIAILCGQPDSPTHHRSTIASTWLLSTGLNLFGSSQKTHLACRSSRSRRCYDWSTCRIIIWRTL